MLCVSVEREKERQKEEGKRRGEEVFGGRDE